MPVSFTLSYNGGLADQRQIESYDIAHALVGFQRTLALTVNVIINGTVITQAPSLKNATIIALPAEPGSWKFTLVILGGLYAMSQAPQNSVIGYLTTSALDYVVSESLGFHIDFSKTLLQQYEEVNRARLSLERQPQSKFDAVIEKFQASIREMHRPIVWSETARVASISSAIDDQSISLSAVFDRDTYEYITYTEESPDASQFVGRISSYNINTFKGRIYVPNEGRPIPFELAEGARTTRRINLVTTSLRVNAISRVDPAGDVLCTGFRNTSRSGQLKSYRIIDVEPWGGRASSPI